MDGSGGDIRSSLLWEVGGLAGGGENGTEWLTWARVGEKWGKLRRDRVGEIGGVLGSERAAGEGIGVLGRDGCSVVGSMMAKSPEREFEVCAIGGAISFDVDRSVSMVLEAGIIESKSAPADSRSIVSMLSNPSSKGRA